MSDFRKGERVRLDRSYSAYHGMEAVVTSIDRINWGTQNGNLVILDLATAVFKNGMRMTASVREWSKIISG